MARYLRKSVDGKPLREFFCPLATMRFSLLASEKHRGLFVSNFLKEWMTVLFAAFRPLLRRAQQRSEKAMSYRR